MIRVDPSTPPALREAMLSVLADEEIDPRARKSDEMSGNASAEVVTSNDRIDRFDEHGDVLIEFVPQRLDRAQEHLGAHAAPRVVDEQRFQRGVGLKVDGIAGPKTLQALGL